MHHLTVFLINVMIVRLIGAANSGIYYNQLYLLNFTAIFFSLGLDYSAIAWLSSNTQLQNTIHNILLRVALFFSVFAALIFLVVIPMMNLETEQSGWGMFFFFTGNLLLILFQGMLSALKKFNTQNTLLIVTNVFFIFFLLVYSRFETIDVVKVSIFYGSLFLTQGLLMLFVSYRKDSKMPALNLSAFYAHGIKIMLSSLIYFCFLRVDNFFVERYCPPDVLGSYVQCGKIGQYFLYFSSVISSTMLPFIVESKIAVTYADWKKIMKPYFFLLFGGTILIAILGPLLYPVIFGPEFGKMQQLMLIFLPGYLSLGLLTLTNAIYLAKGNIGRIFRGDLLGLVLILFFELLFVPKYGVIASAIISSSCYIIVFIYLYIAVKKQFQ